MRKKKFTALVVIFAFLINTLPGAMLNPTPASAYHRDDDQQGHTGTKGGANDNSKPDKIPCPPCRSPVNIRTGEFTYSHQDLLITGRGLPLEVTRSYNSHDVYEGPFGHHWKFNLEIKLAVATSGSQEVVNIRTWDGVRLEFTRNADGSYTAPAGWLDQLVKKGDGSFIWTRRACGSVCSSPRYEFNPSGYLTSMTDPNSNQMSFSYDGKGKLKQVTDASGRTFSISYGSNNKIATITDPAGRTFTYGYDASDNLISYTDPAGNTTTYGYDSAHNLTGITDARGNTVIVVKYNDQGKVSEYTEYGAKWTYTYDPANNTTTKYLPGSWDSWRFYYDAKTGLIVSESDPLYRTTYYSYTDKLYLSKITDPNYADTSFQYDERGNRTGITDALGNKTSFSYHPDLNLVTSVTDALGHATAYDYDDYGNMVQVTDTLGNKTGRTYNQYGQVTKITNASGYETIYTYDGYGYITSITDPLGHIISYKHDVIGNLEQVTDANGKITKYTYDNINRIISITNALNHVTSITYDKNYNINSLTDSGGYITSYEYDTYDRLAKVTDAIGNESLRTYDGMGNVKTETDANGKVTSYNYDLVNRLVTKTFADGGAVNFTYDATGNLIKVQDPKGNIITYTYNAVRRLTQIDYSDGTKEMNTYDKVGDLISKTDQKGNTISYAYDNLNRLTTKTYPDQTQINFTYDELNRLLTAGRGTNDVLTYTYDAINRITKAMYGTESLSYEYDNNGNRIKLVYPDGSYIKYSYDDLNHLDKVKDSTNNVIASFAYDAISRKSSLQYANGTKTTYQYDDLHRNTNVTSKKTSNSQTISQVAYAYDKLFNRTAITTPTGTDAFTYDNKYQIVSVDRANTPDESYSYDSAWNRSSASNPVATTYSVNGMNQYTSIGGSALSYDQNGNLSSDGSRSLQYDYDNNLIQVVKGSDTINYTYDVFGRRTSKSVNGAITKYLYDGEHIVNEVDPQGKTTHYIYGNDIDEVLSMEKTTDGTRYFYHLDGLGSVSALTNSSGSAVEYYSYDSFGKPAISDASLAHLSKSAVGNAHMFTGRIYDHEVGWYHYRARYYSPETGRFLQMDPVGQLLGGFNLYAYVGNNPLNLIDPLGLYDWGGWKTKAAWGVAFITAAGIVIVSGGAAAPVVIAGYTATAGTTALVAGTGIGTAVYVIHEKGQRTYQPETLGKPCEWESWFWVLVKGGATSFTASGFGVMGGNAAYGLKEALGWGGKEAAKQLSSVERIRRLIDLGKYKEAEQLAKEAGYESLKKMNTWYEELGNAFKNSIPRR